MSDEARLSARALTGTSALHAPGDRDVDELQNVNRLATIGELAAGLVHDLATPLNVIVGHAHAIAAAEVEGREAQASAKVIVEQAGRMTKLVKELLHLARRKYGMREPTSLQSLVTEAITYAEPVTRKHGVEVVLDPPLDPTRDLVVPVDAVAIQQVVINLIINGAQAMAPGGRLTIGFEQDGPMAVIHVEDQGVGIAAADLDKIFRPFFTTKSEYGGSGIGLAVSSQIVQGHGGSITVVSTPGEGSRFSVYLPVAC